MGHARNASSGDNGSSRWRARDRALATPGVAIPGSGGGRWWRKEGTGSNRAGLLRGKTPWENKKAAKRTDDQHNVNNAARDQQVAERVADMLDEQFDPDHQFVDRVNEAGMDSLVDMPPGVTFNGQPASDFSDEPDYWCEDNFTSRLAQEMAENARLRDHIRDIEASLAHAHATIDRKNEVIDDLLELRR